MDSAGNFFGATDGDGSYNSGSVFEITVNDCNWQYTPLYVFTGTGDGGLPYGNLISDQNGNLYGTTSAGGVYGAGVVWEITR
jgi:hypothetical protein